jgi:hypothetical protein
MAITTDIQLNQADVTKWQQAVLRNSRELNKSMKSSLAWGMSKICESLGAQTPVAKKLRPVVENPDARYKADKRRARFGVMKYRPTSEQYFVPIYRTGEFGTIRFQNKKTATWFVTDRTTGRTTRDLETGTGSDQIPGIMQSKKRIIGRRKFAKESWRFLKIKTLAGGSINIFSIPDMGSIKWTDGQTAIHLKNKVRYMTKILLGGESAVSFAIAKAANAMTAIINKRVAEKMARV